MAKNKMRRRRKKVDALQNFLNACGFQFAARVIDNWPGIPLDFVPPEKELLIFPVLVNEAFGLELLIKTLYRTRRR